ncbi:Asparagine synthetase [glutamine-hydrolyzing] (EC [Olavius sp. associated proteobacterium Delta 1]|nr:Asparagine synthetase [glutamine-hydrolyzing] (EC [Olavius sp. associated proteobacterium Delta 1]
MCGIAGLFRFDNREIDTDLLLKMRKRLVHRGPEDQGIFVSGHVGLVHNRLKIIDLSERSRQPMSDPSGRYTVVYNGEIYNYIEIKAELERDNVQFNTSSDTEVLLAAYIHWGSDCLHKLNGMFAFAIWDDQEKQLFCARDRLGVKPIYFYQDDQQFVFASEIKALLCLQNLRARANSTAVRDYLMFGMVDHSCDTFFRDIHKLPPANYIRINRRGTNCSRYWDFEISKHLDDSENIPAAVAKFRDHLKEAVQIRLRSDVPVGSCLSGGVDSSSIVCLINSLIPAQHKQQAGVYQKTYSSVFPITALDERPFINDVIAATKAESHIVTPEPQGFLDELDEIMWHQEEPFSSSSIYAQWCVFRKISETGLKVVLDGQGADEQLCGYRKFSYFYLLELFNRHSPGKLFREVIHSLKNFTYFKGIDFKHSLRYFHKKSGWLNPSALHSLFPPVLDADLPEIGYNGSLADRIKLDMTRFSLPSLLRYEDKNSMAFSIESRTPFLDFRIVEFLASLPLHAKIFNGWTKYILREAMKGVIPERIRLRRDKLAFDTPQDEWLRNQWRDMVQSVYKKGGILSENIDLKRLNLEYSKFLTGNSTLSGNMFFRTFLLHKWAERFSVSYQ